MGGGRGGGHSVAEFNPPEMRKGFLQRRHCRITRMRWADFNERGINSYLRSVLPLVRYVGGIYETKYTLMRRCDNLSFGQAFTACREIRAVVNTLYHKATIHSISTPVEHAYLRRTLDC
jgi:hypothetical protein